MAPEETERREVGEERELSLSDYLPCARYLLCVCVLVT